MRRSHLSYAFLLAFLLTIFVLQWYQQASYPILIWQLLGTVGLFGIVGSLLPKTRRMGAFLIAISLGITFAFYSVSRSTHVPSSRTIDWYATGSGVVITGMIADAPDRRAESTKYTVEAQSIKAGSGSLPVRGQILVTDRTRKPYRYGDIVTVRGNLDRPGVIDDFHYDQYLSRYGTYAVIYRASLTPEGRNEGWAILRWLYALKINVENRITELYPEPHASLLIGLLTGSRGSLPEDLSEQFKVTGLTHLIAISGFNITMVITVLSMLLFWLPLRWRFVPSVTLIGLFTLFTGASASVVRAAIMGMLGLFATQLGRQQTTRLTILWTVFLMLCWNPKQLWFDAGFQLSFLAFLGITEVVPLLEKPVRIFPETFGIRDTLHQTIAAQVATVPWMLRMFGRLSLIAPVSNLFAPPLVPWAMLFGTLSLGASLLSPLLGRLVALPAYLCLTGIVLATRVLAAVPFASVNAPKAGALFLVVSYGLIALLAWRRERVKRVEAKPPENSPSLS